MQYSELLKASEKGNTDVVKVLGLLKTWVLCETNVLRMRGVAHMVDLMVAEFILDR